ncbi:MAG: TDP-N-acetylfucosamine:lipid II N-acetylfucosaminyltransferase [Clostridia bacterium]|nr:TDP-N-acetylfucosamine:lipid II N-acetylfucosaminyltransferase [Clostridia bacterium]
MENLHPKRIKYLHLFNGSNYATINNFVRMVNKNFDPREHFFVIRDSNENPKQDISGFRNVAWLPHAEGIEYSVFLAYLQAAEHIFWHAVGWNFRTLFRVMLHPNLMRKSYWVEWGADLYNWRREQKGLRHRIVNKINEDWRKKVRGVIVIFPADEEVFVKQFGDQIPVLHACYVAFPCEKTESLRPETENYGPVNILLGHSATPNCNHIRMLEKLAAYKNENIVVHIPLSYGDEDYAKEVTAKAASLLPAEKLNIIRNAVTLPEYISFLWNMDIGVFDVYRQIALGNIEQLMYMRKKVYLAPDGVLGKYYAENGAEYSDVNEIGDISFEEFTRNDLPKEPPECILKHLSQRSFIAQWKVVFAAAEAIKE